MPNRGKKVISSLSEMELRELWESGTPLDSAWVEFSDSLDDFKLAALRRHPRKDQDIHDDPRYKQLEPWLPKAWGDRQQELHIITTVERVNLLYRIYAGQLWAIGSRTLENGFDELVRVPRELFFVDPDEGAFHEDVYWAKGQLTTDDDSYFDIRVVHAPSSNGMKEISGSPKDNATNQRSDKSRPGRPNTSDNIRTLVKILLKTDRQFQALPDRTAQAKEVRARLLGEIYRDQDHKVGYKTTGIVRIIGELDKEPKQPE